MDKKYHVECKKIFPDGTVVAYDYKIHQCISQGMDLVCHYVNKTGKEFLMTIPNGEIGSRIVKEDEVRVSKYDINKKYQFYHFQWVEDKATTEKKERLQFGKSVDPKKQLKVGVSSKCPNCHVKTYYKVGEECKGCLDGTKLIAI